MSPQVEPDRLVEGTETDPIPIDIYHLIISSLGQPELAACSRVSRSIHPLALERLYKRISIDLDEDFNPLFNRTSKQKRTGKSSSKGKVEVLGLSDRLMGILGIERTISIYAIADIPLLNHKSNAVSPCLCPILRDLRPRRVVLGSDVTGLSGSAKGLWNPFPPPWVKEVVVYLGACTGIELGPEATTSLIDGLPNTVEKLILVFQPRQSPWDGDGRWRFRRVAGIEGLLDPGLLWRAMVKACSGDSIGLEVVGLELVDRDWTELPVRLEKERIREEMRKALRKKGVKFEEEVRRRVEVLVFKERADYIF